MHRHARLSTSLIIFVLALVAGALSLAGTATALNGAAGPAMSMAYVAPHPVDDEAVRAPALAPRHLSAPVPFGLPAEITRPPAAGPPSGDAHPQHHEPAVHGAGNRHGRAPPAIPDR